MSNSSGQKITVVKSYRCTFVGFLKIGFFTNVPRLPSKLHIAYHPKELPHLPRYDSFHFTDEVQIHIAHDRAGIHVLACLMSEFRVSPTAGALCWSKFTETFSTLLELS